MRALAEAPRLLLHYTEIEYEDIMSWDYYGKEWSEIKSKVPFRQLPMLVVDQKHEICQSVAILTFIEKIADIEISDPILNAKANAVMQSAQELFMPLNPTINFAVGDNFKKKREDITPFLNSRFEDLERALKDNEKKFYIDEKPHACDFSVFHHLDLSKFLDPALLNKFPRLEQFIEDNPNNQLSGSAHYWLGELYILEKNYREAALIFAEGFQKFPNSIKAAEMLFKLSQSLYQVEKTTEACKTMEKLIIDFPKNKIIPQTKKQIVEYNCLENNE